MPVGEFGEPRKGNEMSEAPYECGVRQPWSTRTCERSGVHEEHRATLTEGRTYSYWYGDDGPVNYRVVARHVDWRKS
jgi:hypothetical protein